jgi:hypothetical protein
MATQPTHIDFQGHHGFAHNVLFDLNQQTKPGDDGHWAIQDWKQKAKSWALQADLLESRAGMAEQPAEVKAILEGAGGNRLGHTTCGECGEKVGFALEGDRFVAHTACSAPGGLAPYTFDVHVPSGVLVFANDLRPLVLVENHHSANTSIGCKRICEDNAAQGMVHFFVGNTCPAVATRGDALLVANFWADEDDDLDVGVEEEGVHNRICTDLWWASAMDKDLFLERCALFGHDPQVFDFFEVPVVPGVYGVDVLLPDRDVPGDVVHARITRVERPAPTLVFQPPTTVERVDASSMARAIDDTIARPYLGTRTRHQAAVVLLMDSRTGHRWHQGHLRALNGHSGDPKPSMEGVDARALRAATTVPAMPYAPLFADLFDGGGCPIKRVPDKVDRWWLAVSILTAQAALDAHKAWGQAPPPGASKQTAARWSAEKAGAAIATLDALVDRLFATAAQQGATQGQLDAWLVEAHAFLTGQPSV